MGNTLAFMIKKILLILILLFSVPTVVLAQAKVRIPQNATITDSIYPQLPDTYSLGTAELPWSAIYVGNDAVSSFDGTGLSISAGVLSASLSAFDTDDLSEGDNNLYWTQERFDSALNSTTTLDLASLVAGQASTTQLTISDRFWLGSQEVAALDGTGLSFSSGTLNVSGLTVSEFSSANISQWTNDSGYITLASLSGSSPISYDSGSGAISFDTSADVSISGLWTFTNPIRAPGGLNASNTANLHHGLFYGSATSTGPLSSLEYATTTNGLFTQGSGHFGGSLTVDGSITGSNLSGTNTGDVTLAGEDFLSIGSQVITANAINPDNLASADFGEFTCNGTDCAIDSGVIDSDNILDGTVQLVDLEQANVFADADILTYDSATGGFTGKTCAEITGSADLCDGSDDGGGGGGGDPALTGTTTDLNGDPLVGTGDFKTATGTPFSLYVAGDARFDGTATITQSLALGSEKFSSFLGTGLSNVSNALTVDLSVFDTSDLTEGADLYYTDDRVASYLNGSSTIPTTDYVWDISDNTNLAVSGSLLDLTGDTLSVNAGTLTNSKACTFVTGTGFVCNSDFVDLTSSQTISSGIKTFTVLPESSATCSTDNQFCNKDYIDSIGAGFNYKDAVKAASTGDTATSGPQTVDGYSAVAGDRILLKDEPETQNNGCYVVVDPGDWTLCTDSDTDAEVDPGTAYFVQNGTTNAGTQWAVVTDDPITPGTTPITYTQIGSTDTYTAGDGLDLSSFEFSLDLRADRGLQITSTELDLLFNNSIAANASGLAVATTSDFDWTGLHTFTNSRINTLNASSTAVDSLNVFNTFEGAGLTDCDGATAKLLWDATSRTFGCGTDLNTGGGGGGNSSAVATTTYKLANESVSNSSTLQDDDHLKITVDAGTTYTFRFTVFANVPVQPDIQFAVTAPTGSTCRYAYVDAEGAATGVTITTCGATTGSINGNNDEDVFEVVGTVEVGGTGGDITLQWAQGSSNGSAVTVYRGSYMVGYLVGQAPGDPILTNWLYGTNAEGNDYLTTSSTIPIYAQDKFGVGSTTPKSMLVVNSSDSTTGLFQLATTTNQNLFIVNADGNVGINDASPVNLFSVGGSLFNVDRLGNVGVATPTPAFTFQVGDVSLGTYFSADDSGVATTSDTHIIGTGDAGDSIAELQDKMWIGYDASESLFAVSDNNIFNTPLFSVSLSGNATSSGDLSASSLSTAGTFDRIAWDYITGDLDGTSTDTVNYTPPAGFEVIAWDLSIDDTSASIIYAEDQTGTNHESTANYNYSTDVFTLTYGSAFDNTDDYNLLIKLVKN